MEIAVIGTGYVGLVTGVCFALLGHRIICIDRDVDKIDELAAGRITIYEPGLEEELQRQQEERRLFFTTSMTAVSCADIVILAVGTPQKADGESDLTDLEAAVRSMAIYLSGHTYIMTKSTVPVGTNEQIEKWIKATTNEAFDVVSVPEFMREGSALSDTLKPERVIIGARNAHASEAIAALHRPLTEQVVETDYRTAEMIKYASNAFLATKISFINEMANICDKVGADVVTVAQGMGMDRRIGSSFLEAGIGYGGSCFPKDTHALLQIAGDVDYDFKLLKAVIEVNKDQRRHIRKVLLQELESLSGKFIAVWGASFKPNTDDVRHSPVLDIVRHLLKEGASVRMSDPAAELNFRRSLDHPLISWHTDPLEAAQGADAVCLLTDWPQFLSIDLHKLKAVMTTPILFDGRNAIKQEQLVDTGIRYVGIGRPGMRGIK
ncbi:UDP-glucose 6-dehydrogenase TuaD [Paenibacillus baekrokdamisoli]|uniref:UDP-glucose 6-dehydrogenase n=1 Tax=Paenibacillus baekrokdamisoli TaxID=1712516 RepID=A0A3G9IU91_9BACL|nr:UDP-glucose/GDP-mannose dehydrogenase family protein [Paenibacillus baekrokdamisoli]MBB3071669.1 UDPglucose 6-dehydrogenase [Paenibacillus baekrokdamisoli]BBH21822.1 UDP-glucose 6-dehydrogenase TuaD [Paenibacillus baekrokdamisoli]